jgi:hypothetical protein
MRVIEKPSLMAARPNRPRRTTSQQPTLLPSPCDRVAAKSGFSRVSREKRRSDDPLDPGRFLGTWPLFILYGLQA